MTRNRLFVTLLTITGSLTHNPLSLAESLGWNCRTIENGQFTCTAGDPLPRETIPAPTPLASTPGSTQTRTAKAIAPGSVDDGIERTAGGELCKTRFVSESEQKDTLADDSAHKVNVSADEVEMERSKNLSHFKGNVVVTRGTQKMLADEMDYNRETDVIDARDNVRFSKGVLTINAEDATYDIAKGEGEFNNTKYQLASKHAHGTASKIEKEGATRTHLTDATYTTCDPGKDDWLLSADKVDLKHDEGRGEAYNTTLRFMGVPFLYTPYMQFPITDERMSGFLTPSFGTSSEGGADLSVPYYWNIAPNLDATTTVRYMSDRGVQLAAETRYMTIEHNGQVDLEYLPSDNAYNDDRTLFSYQNSWAPGDHWNGNVLFNYISDNDYFTDLSGSLSSASVTHLDRRADVSYTTDVWTASALVESFQTVDSTIAEASRPYKRLPRLGFNALLPDQIHGLNYSLDAEYVYFDHSINTKGHRLHLSPGVSLPIETLGWFVTPSLKVSHTSYSLDNVTPGNDDAPSRTLPIFSLDSGVFFERDTKFGNTAFLQTLEPRLFYLYVPNKTQTAIPVFDTSSYDFSVSQLFSENRFSGIDRIGDANQLTAAVTTRLLESNGHELASATLGQIFYFRDRNVVLPGGTAETKSDSDIIAALSWNPTNNWKISSELQWDNNNTDTSKGAFSARYNADDKHIFNISHRFQRNSLEQIDVAAYWALNSRWSAIGRWNHSLSDEQDLEYLAGLEYQSCCWAVQLVARNYLNGPGSTDNATIMLQLKLKGLTSLGSDIDTLLEEGILGYKRD